jgi:hypothetical protein
MSNFAKADSCSTGQHFVRAYHRRAYYKADGTYVSASQVGAHCQNNPSGYSFWSNKFSSGVPRGWPWHDERSRAWTEEERERVLEALGEIPDELWNLSAEGIYRLDKSFDFPNPATSAERVIALYDTAFIQKRNLAQVLAHELAHMKYKTLSPNDELDYRMATNWIPQKENPGRYYARKEGYVEEDGRMNPEEDFANNVEYYLFNPEKLKRVTPYAFKWIQSHFSDKFRIRGSKGAKR